MAHRLCHCGWVNETVPAYGNDRELDALTLDPLARIEHGVVLERGGDYVVAITSELADHALDCEVVGLGPSPGEHDLGGARPYRRGYPLASLLDGCFGSSSVGMDRRRVAEIIPEVGKHELSDLGENGGRGGVIQVMHSPTRIRGCNLFLVPGVVGLTAATGEVPMKRVGTAAIGILAALLAGCGGEGIPASTHSEHEHATVTALGASQPRAERLRPGVIRSVSGRSRARVVGSDGVPYEASGRALTRLVVSRPAENFRETFELPGDFEPEAFSTDEEELFLIEHLDSERYRVRMMKLDTGRVFPISRLTKFAPNAMRGVGRVQVYAPKGDFLFTLYTRQPPNTAHRSLDSYDDHGEVHAFVHVLNLKRGWAHCVDLPSPFGTTDEPADEIAISSDGRRVFVSDGERLAVVDARELIVSAIITGASFADVADADLIYPKDQPFAVAR